VEDRRRGIDEGRKRRGRREIGRRKEDRLEGEKSIV